MSAMTPQDILDAADAIRQLRKIRHAERSIAALLSIPNFTVSYEAGNESFASLVFPILAPGQEVADLMRDMLQEAAKRSAFAVTARLVELGVNPDLVTALDET